MEHKVQEVVAGHIRKSVRTEELEFGELLPSKMLESNP